MNVTSATDTTGTQSTSTTSSTSSSNMVSYNTFLQLLIAEMKNQDPTNPTDTAQYMSAVRAAFERRAGHADQLEARCAAVLAVADAGG